MNIQGLQKMTLLDYPEHVACTVFLGGCDFRCPFCHNYELVEATSFPYDREPVTTLPPAISDKEFFDFLDKRRGLLDGVCITGGEPCLRKDLPEFIARIKDMGFLVKLDTNGNHPEVLRPLIDQKLVDYVAMDVKNSPEKYALTIGLEAIDLDPVMESISILIEGNVPYEFRTTVMAELHEEEDFDKIGEMIKGAEKYYIQSFVDRDTVPNHNFTAPDEEKLRKFREKVGFYVHHVELRGTTE